MRPESVPQSDDLAYRDYLLDVVRVGTSDTHEFGVATPEDANWLGSRFKQVFTTTDNAAIGANSVACEALSRALAEDLALLAPAIPTQGAGSPRAHLDALIAASGNSRDELERMYCIDLGRSDLEETTRVRENITTLQRYLADGPIPDRGLYLDLPFFLYKDEWRLQKRTPFFPENHRRVLHGSFTAEADRTRAIQLVTAAASLRIAPNPAKPEDTVLMTADTRFNGFVERLKQLIVIDTTLLAGHRFLAEGQFRLADDRYLAAKALMEQVAEDLTYKWWGRDSSGTDIKSGTCKPDLGEAASFADSLNPSGEADYVFEGSDDWSWVTPAWWKSWWKAFREDGSRPGWAPIDVGARKLPPKVPFTMHLFDELHRRYQGHMTAQARSMTELQALEAWTTVAVNDNLLSDATEWAVIELHDELLSVLPHQYNFTIPVCRAAAAQGLGDYPGAATLFASIVRESLMRATLATQTPDAAGGASDEDGDLPWSWTTGVAAVGRDYPYLNPHCDAQLMLLRVAALYLEWADDLYRSDRFTAVARARKLYQVVLHLYGIEPIPAPQLDPVPPRARLSARTALSGGPRPGLDLSRVRRAVPSALPAGTGGGSAPPALTGAGQVIGPTQPGDIAEVSAILLELAHPITTAAETAIVVGILMLPINPAMLAQQRRAELALAQIAAGANYFGYRHDVVPLLRYRSLITAAKHYATSAAQAESKAIDFAAEAARTELELVDVRTAVSTAQLRVMIESERIVKADDARLVAEVRVQKVKDAIVAKKAEIADHNSLCGQVGDWFTGITSFFSKTPDKVGKYMQSDASAAIGISAQPAGATAGLGIVGGMALWGIGNAVALSGMADEANARVAALKNLEEQDLFAASAALDASRRELAIAQGQKVIAHLEAQVAEEVYRYLALQFLDHDLWTRMAATMHSVLRRYLELGAMTGWLAERALSYEQDRDIRAIHLDYYDAALKGLTGSARLQSDLALLEAEHLTGYDSVVPLTWTVSLAQRYPLQFGQLKATGHCMVSTTSNDLRRAYPGSHSHRVRVVEVISVQSVADPPTRGVLSNNGVSTIVGSDGSVHSLTRPADTFPLSEFRLNANHLAIYRLPDIGLMPFEGSGFDTTWLVELPKTANPRGLDGLLDLCLTFHMDTEFSEGAADLPDDHPYRIALLSARELFTEAWEKFQVGPHTVTFDVTEAHLEPVANRVVTNVGIFLVGHDVPDVQATLAVAERDPIDVAIHSGSAHSTQVAPPATVPGAGGADLDGLFDGQPIDPVTSWRVALHDQIAPVQVSDVWLALEYTTS